MKKLIPEGVLYRSIRTPSCVPGTDTMKIAIITDSYIPTTDGVVTAVITTKKELEKRGHEVTVIAPDPGKEHREEETIYFPAISFKKYKGYYLPVFRSNKIEIIKRLDPDIIHIFGVTLMALKGLIASHTLRIPTVTTYVTSVGEVINDYSPIKLPYELMDKLVWIYLRNFLKRPDALVVPTAPIATELTERGVRPKRLETIHIGIDIDRFRRNDQERSRIREKHGLGSRKVLICAGRLSAEKNHILLIRSMLSVDKEVVLLIVGKGPMDAELRRLTNELSLDDRIIFTGFVPDEELVSYYSAADVTVSCSEFETQGLTTLEAMACGLPAACADARAFSDTIVNGVNGYKFKSTEEDCIRAINACIERTAEMTTEARRTAEMNSIRETAEKLEKLYWEVVSSYPRSIKK